MIICSGCGMKISPYCTKTKAGIKIRYFKCIVCETAYKSVVIENEKVKISKKVVK